MPSILIVDDEANIRRMLAALLREEGFTVAEAPNGNAALLQLDDVDPDVVLLDLLMPRLDGLGATAQIHAMSDTITPPSIVALTANALAGDIERLLDAGMDGYLSKPITLGALSELLQAIDAGDGLPHARR